MNDHARPHLETHSRKLNHSAVAGAAYRLGLRLYDERAEKFADFRKRKAGDEIVCAFTVGPNGAARWALSPDSLWNAVEKGEKRKDAQLARDYRMPLPLGISDEQAENMSREMARFIADLLNTPVSVGVHRDGTVDALGLAKTPDKVGVHAHLYFPCRPLKEDGLGFGEKFAFLSNKNSSGEFVEKLNARWSALSNFHAEAIGVATDFDHRSYKRQGIDKVAQPTLGAAAVALERQGIPSRRGDRLRVLMASPEAFQANVMVQLAKRRAGAMPAGQPVQMGAGLRRGIADSILSSEMARKSRSGVLGRRTVIDQNLGLGQAVRRAGPKPNNLQEKEAQDRAILLADIIEAALNQFEKNRVAEAQFRERLAQASAARLAVESDLDDLRSRRSTAHQAVRDWERDHPLQHRAAKIQSKPNAKHAQLKALVAARSALVQAKKHELAALRSTEAKSAQDARESERAWVDAEVRLRRATMDACTIYPAFLTYAAHRLSQAHRALLASFVAKPGDAPGSSSGGEGQAAGALTLRPAASGAEDRPKQLSP